MVLKETANMADVSRKYSCGCLEETSDWADILQKHVFVNINVFSNRDAPHTLHSYRISLFLSEV